MAQTLQHDQAALVTELSTAGTADINPGNSSGSERSHAVVSIPLVQNIRQVTAAVRIAMTVASPGVSQGVLYEVVKEEGLKTDAPLISLRPQEGIINSDLTVGVDLARCSELTSNDGLAARGMVLHGSGFLVTTSEAEHLGLGKREGLERHIRKYKNGRDLMGVSRELMVIDLFGLTSDDVRKRFPEVYQHVKLEVKEKIKINKKGESEFVGRDWNDREYRKLNWWLFGENVPELRKALEPLPRYFVTVETMKHRVFQFVARDVLPDNKLVAIASDDAFHLGVCSSRIHIVWSLRAGGWLGVGNDPVYSKSRCFDPFPFPDANNIKKQTIRVVTEELDAHRKRVLEEHPHLTLTGIYNVLEKLRAGTKPDDLDVSDHKIFEDGLVVIIKELHDRLDVAVADAYGWPSNLSDDDILSRLVALNKERAEEEKRGLVRWLRPDYQIPRFGKTIDKQEAREEGAQVSVMLDVTEKTQLPSFPTGAVEQTAAVFAVLAGSTTPLDAKSIAAQFKATKTTERKIDDVLASLARLGHAVQIGEMFALRRVA